MEAPKRALDAPGGTVSQSSRTDLAAGAINGSDRLAVELIEADDMPLIVAINWPARPTICNPDRFPDTAAAVARLMARASTEPARIKSGL